MKSVELNITTWEGLSIGAEHYYGELHWTDNNGSFQIFELKHILTDREAKYLSKKSGCSDFGAYQKGDKTIGFNSEQLVIQEARRIYKEEYPDAEFLFKGTGHPALILDSSDKELMDKANRIFEKANIIWDWTDEKETLYQEWKRVLNG